MKAIFAIFAMCLVAVNAGVIEPVNYEGLVNDIMHEAADLAVATAKMVEHQIDEIVLDPLQQVDAAVESIESRRPESEVCVAAVDDKVTETVDAMHEEMYTCGFTAAKQSGQIAIDVSAATQQLVFDGYECLSLYNKCRNYNNSVLKNSCYARLSIKATLYLKNARRSIKTIKQSQARIPDVFAEADVCTHHAADEAIQELENLHATIDACVSKF